MPVPQVQPSDEPAVKVPWPLVALLAALPAVLAVAQLGRIHPDEVYQSLEPAYARAFGYGVLAWEWQVGLRNWAVPLLLSWLLKVASGLGLADPQAMRAVVALPQVLLHGLMLAAVYRYCARRAGGLAYAGLLAMGLFGPVLLFAGRTLGESFSTAFLVIALERLERERDRPAGALWGGACLGLSVVTRYGSAVVVLSALVWLLAARRFRTLLLACAGGLLVALALGALDWATWGKPFHSLWAYLDFNLLSGKAAAQFGSEPAGFYRDVLWHYLPVWTLPGLLWAAFRLRPRVSLPLFAAVAYLLALTLTDHKEHRFAYPGLVLLALAALPGLLHAISALSRPSWRWAAGSGVVGLALAPLLWASELSVQRADQFQALVRAGRQATGLLLVNEGLWGAGGYFYLGKQIPWLTCDFPSDGAYQTAMADPRFNRVVSYDERALEELQASGFQIVERIGRATVLSRGP